MHALYVNYAVFTQINSIYIWKYKLVFILSVDHGLLSWNGWFHVFHMLFWYTENEVYRS